MASPDSSNNSHEQIISVGIIGCTNHSLYKHYVSKQLISNHITNSINDDHTSLYDPFEWIRTFQSATKNDKCIQKSMLSIYDDTESGIIYFNLKSHHNPNQLTKLLTKLSAQKSHYEFHRILQQTETTYLKSLIFIFLTCHHILLFQNTPRFNPQWLSIFHFLQEIKLKLIPCFIDMHLPIFNHIINSNDKNKILSYLSTNNLPPFIIPVLTFLYPPPNTSGYIVLDDKNNKVQKDDNNLIEKAVLRKFKQRLQQQIVVLLRRCHSIFPYFQTTLQHKYSSMNEKQLFHSIDVLKGLGFDTVSYLDEEIYSTHSRWIETDDMMHNNPLSLFSLLPNKFIQIYDSDMVGGVLFLFSPHESLSNDMLLYYRKQQECVEKLCRRIKKLNQRIKGYLRGECVSESFSGKIKGGGGEYKNMSVKKMPSRVLFYVSSKAIYDSLFKNLSEINAMEDKYGKEAYLRVYNLFNYDDSHRKNKKFYAISHMEKNYNKIAMNLDIDRLGRYSSLLCRRAYKSARNTYLRDLPDMYPMFIHQRHIRSAMKVYRQLSVGPLQEYYCRQLYFCFNDEIWKNGGRQACDAISLTSRACCRPIHVGKNLNILAMKKNESAKFAEERYSKFGRDPCGHFSGFSSSHACNCGRSICKREDPFDLYDANVYYFQEKCCLRVQWNYSLYYYDKQDGQKEDVKKSGFNLCNHGGAELYHKQTGITQPGFARYNCFLLRWDIPTASNIYIFHQHFKQKNQRYRDNYFKQKYAIKNNTNEPSHVHVHPNTNIESIDENLGLWIHKIRKTVSIAQHKPNCNAYFPCFVGLEFECYRGHRSIYDIDESFEDDKRFVGTQFPVHNVPLRVPCKQCQHFNSKQSGGSGNIINGQLQRCFIVTPPPPVSITAQPVIRSALCDAIFEFETPIVLPPSSFLVLRFPYIYFHEGRGLPPDKLALLKGMLSVYRNGYVGDGDGDVDGDSWRSSGSVGKIVIKHKDK